MFTSSSIRAQARETINKTPGIYLLAILPIVVVICFQIFVQVFSMNMQSSMLYNFDYSYTLTSSELFALYQPLFSLYLFSFFVSILVYFLYLSVQATIYQIVRQNKEQATFKDSIAIFSNPNFGKIFSTVFIKNLLLFVWSLISFIGLTILITSLVVTIVFSAMTFYGQYQFPTQDFYTGAIVSIFIGFLITIIGIAIYLPQQYAYSMTEIILFERLENGQYTSAYANIKESRRIMKGYKFRRFVLDFSFLGWFILEGISLGIAGVYVRPYYYAAQVHFYDAVLEERRTKGEFF
ncbi:TPA: DUF975 family protein [Streptococcus suis]